MSLYLWSVNYIHSGNEPLSMANVKNIHSGN